MTEPENKPADLPVSQGGDDYRKLSIQDKRKRDLARARDAALRCPRCEMQVMPRELLKHIDERCTLDLPTPSPAARWLNRIEAMRLAPASRVDVWIADGVVRQREDGRVLERDLVLAVAWAQLLGAL